jgi:hypothetical protein
MRSRWTVTIAAIALLSADRPMKEQQNKKHINKNTIEPKNNRI